MQDEHQDISRGFATLAGFLQTSNIRSDHYHANYQWYPKHSIVQSDGRQFFIKRELSDSLLTEGRRLGVEPEVHWLP